MRVTLGNNEHEHMPQQAHDIRKQRLRVGLGGADYA